MALGTEVGDAFISIHADTTKFRADLSRLNRIMGNGAKKNRDYANSLKDLNKQLDNIRVGNKDVVDSNRRVADSNDKNEKSFVRVGRAARRSSNLLTRAGNSIKSSWRGMDSTVRVVLALIAVAAPQMAALGSGLSSFLVGLLAVAGTAVVPLLAMAGVLPVLVLGITAAVAGMKDLEKFSASAKQSLDGLTSTFSNEGVPALMREWADAVGALFDTLKGFVGADVLGPIGAALRAITESLTGVLGGDIGTAFKEALVGPLTTAFQLLGQALMGPLLSYILQFLTASAPYAAQLAQHFYDWADALNKAFSGKIASGEFTTFMDGAMESLRVVLELFGAVKDVIATLFVAGMGPGQEMLGIIIGFIEQFDAWMNSLAGQSALQQWFENGLVVMDAVFRLLGSVGAAIADLVTPDVVNQLVGLLDGLGEFAGILGDILAAVGEANVIGLIVEILQSVGEIVTPLLPALTEIAHVLSDVLITALDGLAKVLVPVLDLLGPFLVTVIEKGREAFEKLEPVFAVLAERGKELAPQFLDMLSAFLDFAIASQDKVIPLMGEIAEVLINDVLPALFEFQDAMLPLIQDIVDLFTSNPELLITNLEFLLEVVKVGLQILPFFYEVATKIVGVIKFLMSVAAFVTDAFWGFVNAVKAVLEWLSPLFDIMNKVREIFISILAPIVEFFIGVHSTVNELIAGMVKLFYGLGVEIGTFVSGVVSKFWGLVLAVTDNFAVLRERIGNFIDNVKALPQNIENAFDGLANTISAPFKSAFNYIVDIWNKTVGKLSFTIPDWIPGIGGNTFSMPKMQKYARGGIASGPSIFGEGYGREAAVPLDLPLHLVDPSVRWLAAIAQGKDDPDMAGASSSRTVSVGDITVVTPAGDPRVVAETVVDRIVAQASLGYSD